MQEKYRPYGLIGTVIADNGYVNGSNAIAWETINQKVAGGELSAQDVFLFGLSGSQPTSFPSGQVAKSLEIKQARADIQDQIFNDPKTPDPTAKEVWEEFEALIRKGRFTAKDVYYYGAFERSFATSIIDDGDGE